jgi:hypothetical protein
LVVMETKPVSLLSPSAGREAAHKNRQKTGEHAEKHTHTHIHVHTEAQHSHGKPESRQAEGTRFVVTLINPFVHRERDCANVCRAMCVHGACFSGSETISLLLVHLRGLCELQCTGMCV